MKKINLEEKITKLNNFCKESRGKSFTGAQLCEALMNLGFTKTISGNIAQKCFPFEKKYDNKRRNKDASSSSKDSTSEAWEILVKAGKVRQKFDINKLKKDYPLIYAKCLTYEIIQNI